MDEKQLIKIAREAMQNAYVPFSGFKVGAALLAKSGKVYKGCNIEICTVGNSICAERNVMFKAVSENEHNFEAIAVIADTQDFIYPCGICRQVLAEFCDDDFKILCSNINGEYETYLLKDLLPKTFRLKHYEDGVK